MLTNSYETYHTYKHNIVFIKLISKLDTVKYVTTTVDVWSTFKMYIKYILIIYFEVST